MTDDSTDAVDPFLTEREEAVYLAAIFDGEGSMCTRARPNSPTFQPKFSISMTDLDILERMQRLGGWRSHGSV